MIFSLLFIFKDIFPCQNNNLVIQYGLKWFQLLVVFFIIIFKEVF